MPERERAKKSGECKVPGLLNTNTNTHIYRTQKKSLIFTTCGNVFIHAELNAAGIEVD